MRLENWARSWHRPDAPRYFAGSLGGASLSQVYCGNVMPDAIVTLLKPLDVEFQLAKWGDGANQAAGLLPRDVSAFLSSRRADVDESCSILATAKVPMPGGTFEPQIVIEVRITWVPLLAFRRIRDLKGRLRIKRSLAPPQRCIFILGAGCCRYVINRPTRET